MIALVFVLISPLIGIAGARWLRHRWPKLRWPLLVLTALTAFVIVAAAWMAMKYPGPAAQYTADSIGHAIRERFVYPGSAFAIALPGLLALCLCYLVPGSNGRTAAIACGVGYLAVPLALGALLFTGCTYAGACF